MLLGKMLAARTSISAASHLQTFALRIFGTSTRDDEEAIVMVRV